MCYEEAARSVVSPHGSLPLSRGGPEYNIHGGGGGSSPIQLSCTSAPTARPHAWGAWTSITDRLAMAGRYPVYHQGNGT